MTKDSYDTSVILVLLVSVLFTGVNGLLAFVLFLLFSKIKLGRDPEVKHGLSAGTSRLGGIAIAISIVIGCCSHIFFQDQFSIRSFLSGLDKIIVLSFLLGIIGLVEDFRQNLTSITRLILMLFLVSISLYLSPELIPLDMAIFEYISLSDSYIFMYLFTVIMVSGFINAGNIADGANGLLPSIFLGYFAVAYSLDNSVFNFSVMISLIAFIIFNVSTGRIFLGDFGAYSLSALVAFKSLEFYSSDSVSIFFFASILIYPCFEITRSIAVRYIKKSSLFNPDNNHLHNLINQYMLTFKISKHNANSLTGLSIAILSSLPPVCLYFFGISEISDLWITIFSFQFFYLTLIYIIFEKKFSSSYESLL